VYDVRFRTAALLTFLAASALVAFPDDPGAKPYTPDVKPASKEWEASAKRIRVPKGMKLDLWAAEPLLANPVVFCIDDKNRFFVAETFRLHAGVPDIRGIMSWLDDDLACRTVEDRVAMMKRRMGKKFADTGVHQDRVRLVEDTQGTGKADKSTVFADGFGKPESGLGAGVLARGKDVYYTCIPDLWKLTDTKGTGKADKRVNLATGFGIHIGFIGHDLHGLVMGPDGKLYFSIGDRGINVKTKEGKHLFYPDQGSVMRCNPDGSDLEVFATGLRNPQELAFDKNGNLFTCDNNSDSGDRARWVYLVEGGDSGWRIGYQFDGAQGSRGPWNAEKLWHPQHEGQAAWVVPPIANLADGPSGLAYYPGMGLAPRYEDHFFLADFRGGPGPSGVRSYANKPKGAGFELIDSHEFVWGTLATDVAFGTDSAVYISDWVDGWGLTGKGRIWKVTDEKFGTGPAIDDAKKILFDGFEHRKSADLVKLLDHKNIRIRQEAQFAIAARPTEAVAAFTGVLSSEKNPLARLHAIWGLGIAGRKDADALNALIPLLADKDAEVRSQAAKILGEGKVVAASKALIALLADDESRVRFFAAQALGKLHVKDAIAPLAKMLRDNADADPWLRHGGILGLAGCGDAKTLDEAARDASPAVRRAVLLALRRQKSPEVARFLSDADAEIVTEAARAVYDAEIDEALPRLAALVGRSGLPEPLAFRVLNANLRLGTLDNARAVAAYAARKENPEKLRKEALLVLEKWDKPAGRDRILGTWRPLLPRTAGVAAAALKPSLGGIFTGPAGLRKEAARIAAKLGIKEIGPTLFALVADKTQPAGTRVETLRALAALKDERVTKAVELALADAEPTVRSEGRRILAAAKPDEALPSLEAALDKGMLVEQQQAFDVLATMKGAKPTAIIAAWLDRLIDGKVPAELRLDLIEAAEKRKDKELDAKIRRHEATGPKGDPFGLWRYSRAGGNAEAGWQIFLNRSEVSCLRCHKAAGEGVGEVGPDLTGIGSRQNRDYLLESIVFPNKQIAKGFETVDLVLTSGQIRSGILKSEDAKEVKLMTAEGALVTVRKDRIEDRKTGKSAMPEDLVKHLSRRDARDLVEFLAGLKEVKK
jgi:quinoprotein glucose dehydrogenase